MAEVDHLIVATLPKISGLPEDSVENAFAFYAEDTAWDFDAACAGIVNFYNTGTTGSAVAAYLSNFLDRGADQCTFEDYNITGHLDGSIHGVPVDTKTWTLGAAHADQDDVPAECGAVVTLYAEGRDTASVELAGPPVQRPKSSKTGRLYIGPLTEWALDDIADERRLKAAFCDDLAAAALALSVETATADIFWSVWSRKLEQVRAIVGGHVDNALDTQRRRGPAATARVRFGLAG